MTKKFWFVIVNGVGVASCLQATSVKSFSLEYWVILLLGNFVGQIIYSSCKDDK